MERTARAILGFLCFVYLLFVVASARLAVVYSDERGLSLGEGAFTLLGGVTLGLAAARPRRWAPLGFVGTLPLVGWFVATPWNSGPPFLISSLVAPIAAAAIVASHWFRRPV